MSLRLLALAALLLWACAQPAGRPPADPALPAAAGDAREDAVRLLRAYLRIDTTNPPGRELATARFLKRVLDREGIESRIYELGGGRANLRAVLPGDGKARPVVLLHHMDVVSADARHWRVPPFSGEVVRGEIYGRGAVDIKGKGIIDLAALLHLKRSGRRLHRDVIYLAVADEEVASLGTEWMVERPELLRGAEILLDEGTSVRLGPQGRPEAYIVSIGEKAPLWLTLTFTGRAGHGSEPIEDSSVNRAIRAAARLLARPPRPRLLEELRPWLELKLRGRDLSRLPGWAGDLRRSLEQPGFLVALQALEEIGPALGDTISITGLRGSDKVNVIPNEAELRLDCRLLPGTDREQFLRDLRATLADPTVRIRVDEKGATLKSPTGTALWRALERVAARRDPGVPVVPTILLSSTDSSAYRRLGIHAYGFEPYRITDALAELAHGNDERLPVAAVREGVDLLVDILTELDRL